MSKNNNKGVQMNKIYEYRKQKNITQSDFAYRLNQLGISCAESDISRWERGLQIPSSNAREIISEIIGISEYELLCDIITNLDYKNYRNKGKTQNYEDTG